MEKLLLFPIRWAWKKEVHSGTAWTFERSSITQWIALLRVSTGIEGRAGCYFQRLSISSYEAIASFPRRSLLFYLSGRSSRIFLFYEGLFVFFLPPLIVGIHSFISSIQKENNAALRDCIIKIERLSLSFVDSGFRSGERGHVALVSHLQTAASRSETSHDPGKKNIFPPKTRSFLILTVTFLFPVQKYEPVFTAGSQPFVHHMNVYECVGDPSVFEVLAATEGSRCYQPSMPPLFFNCNNVVVAWTAGSEVRIQFRPYQFCNKNSRFLSLFCPHKWKGFHVPIRSWLSDESGRRRQVFHARDPLRQPEPAERHRRSLGPPSLLHFSTQVTTSSYSSPIGILHGRIPPPKPAGHQRKQKTRDNWPVFFVVVTVEERGGRPPAILLQQKRLVVLLSSTSSDRNVFDLLLYFSLFFLVSLYGPLQQPQKTQGANQCLADVLDARVVNAGHLNSAPFLGSSDTTKEREVQFSRNRWSHCCLAQPNRLIVNDSAWKKTLLSMNIESCC